jgi:hypothetical protein
MDQNREALLISLSRYLRPAMSLPSIGVSEPISEDLATFADSRHRVGPLLHLAWQRSADMAADKNASAILKTSYQANVFGSLRQKAAERKIANLLISHSVPFSFLKGRGLAEQLHDDPTVRQSKDVDILVSPDRSRQAIKLLNHEGYIFKSDTLRRKKRIELTRQDMELKFFKDITFIDPAVSVPIELHGRLFKFEPKGLTNDFNDSVRSTAVPLLSNSFYCLYLILHGSLAMWPRLKWLVDLSIMARKMPVQSRLQMMDIAKFYGCEVAVAASILMAEEIFSGSLDDDWQSLLEPFQKDENLLKMQGLYYECLEANAVGRPSYPLKSFLLSGAADLVFPGKIGLFETLFKRFVNSLAVRI